MFKNQQDDQRSMVLHALTVAKNGLASICRRFVTDEINMGSKQLYRALLRVFFVIAALSSLHSEESGQAVWFGDLIGSQPLSEAASQMAAEIAVGALLGRETGSIPLEIARDKLPRIVFIALSDSKSRAVTQIGCGYGVLAAVQDALAKHRSSLIDTEVPVYIRIDIVDSVIDSLDHRGIRGAMAQGFAGSTGVASSGESQRAMLLEEVIAKGAFGSDDKSLTGDDHFMEEIAIRAFGARSIKLESHFLTRTFFLNTLSGDREVKPIRDSTRPIGWSLADIANAIESGAAYLARSVGSDGRLRYLYDPSTDVDLPGYNILRHAGAVNSMLEAFEFNHNPESLKAAERALTYLVSQELAYPGREDLSCIVEDAQVKVGGQGLALIALAKYTKITGDRVYLRTMRSLASWLVEIQDRDGGYSPSIVSYPDRESLALVSKYYQGEAILGLVRLFEVDHDVRWLESASRGGDWVVNQWDQARSDRQLEIDNWLLCALSQLYYHDEKPSYLSYVSQMALAIVDSQNTGFQGPASWSGGYGQPPDFMGSATKMEGLTASYWLLRFVSWDAEARKALRAILSGIGLQLLSQFTPASVLYFDEPGKALGGFRRSLYETSIRMDYVQHNLSAFVAVWNMLNTSGESWSAEARRITCLP